MEDKKSMIHDLLAEKQFPVLKHRYDVECIGPDGKLKWSDFFYNVNPTVGLNKYLSMTLVSGLASPTWFVGLVGATHTYAAADTMASHGGWAEGVMYTGNRPAFTPNAGDPANGAISNSASKASFTISGTETINGCFLTNDWNKNGNTGTLLGEGDFTGGAKSVGSGDTLNVQVSGALT